MLISANKFLYEILFNMVYTAFFSQKPLVPMLTFTELPALSGSLIELKPLTLNDETAIAEAVTDGELWNLWYTSVPSPQKAHSYVSQALTEANNGQSLPFAIFDKSSNQLIGCSRYCNIDWVTPRLEIGYTWLSQSYHGRGYNTELKLLMLQFAFEQLKVVAVEFRTHWHNQRSRRAIAALGAKKDGVLRQHKRTEGSQLRDTVVFSILDSEWPTVKLGLTHKLSQQNLLAQLQS